jgi:hypothetical protein
MSTGTRYYMAQFVAFKSLTVLIIEKFPAASDMIKAVGTLRYDMLYLISCSYLLSW